MNCAMLYPILNTGFSALTRLFLPTSLLVCSVVLQAEVGDPQIRTDHPFYPGELACSTFDRLFATQAEQYQHITGRSVTSEQDRVLASWFWRNTHYAHGEEGAENLWGDGFTQGDLRTREYWTGLFAHGFGLCGTTHSQWTAEMESLLGHGRARGVGVSGHNSFEVFLRDPIYPEGKWALLDHDISTVIFDSDGQRLLSIPEIRPRLKDFTSRNFQTPKQNGWLVCGLHPDDGSVYDSYNTAEYLAGYAAVPPIVHLRRGEVLRRYFAPGLDDGKTFAFWGRNYRSGGIPGPERSLTWVNQPEKMFKSSVGAGYHEGQARYGNAVYEYAPDFATTNYREGIVSEDEKQVTFEFYSPYIIAATPPNDHDWGIYEPGCRNGLLVRGRAHCGVSISVDQGQTWKRRELLGDRIDFTDEAKGHRQYFLKFHTPVRQLAGGNITIRTVCQANPAIFPRLREKETAISYAASNQAILSAGPNRRQATAHLVAGAFDSPTVTLSLATPRRERIKAIYAAGHIASGNPPDPAQKYFIDYSVDQGTNWHPLVADWQVVRQGEEPHDFWSQSFCYGNKVLAEPATEALIRF
ncbi:MAG TPA: hypothetical protein VK633_03385, partial [Verrucomicrobiae bacterium]|nr:hypothetical protein [Verrucomicrobiae bacterium]